MFNSINVNEIITSITPLIMFSGVFLVVNYITKNSAIEQAASNETSSNLANNNNVPNLDLNQIENNVITNNITSQFDINSITPNNIKQVIMDNHPNASITADLMSNALNSNLYANLLNKISFIDTMITCQSQFQDRILFNMTTFENSMQVLVSQTYFLLQNVEQAVLYSIVDLLIPVLMNPYGVVEALRLNETITGKYKELLDKKLKSYESKAEERIQMLRLFGSIGILPSRVSFKPNSTTERTNLSSIIKTRQIELGRILSKTAGERSNFRFSKQFPRAKH